MQNISTAMQTALAARLSATDDISRNRVMLFEVYASGFFPDANGVFDPSLAIARWAKTNLTWLGNTYQRRIIAHATISQFITGKFNNTTLTIENADRYLSQFLATNDVNGMRLVIRYINIDLSAALADSVVCFVGRIQAPDNTDIDREQGDLTALEELASLDIQIPKRTVSPYDPSGRSPNDPLYEGYSFNARPSTVKFVEHTSTRKFLIFSKNKDVIKYNQWSSQSEADDAIVPLVIGRAQQAALVVFWFDPGFYIIGIFLFAAHKVTAIDNFQLPDTNYIFYGIWSGHTLQQSHVHLGDPGGTGSNATADNIENNYPQNTALLSRSAYAAFAIGGPESATQPFANPQMDSAPTLVGIVLGEMDLPDGDGVFNQKGFSDSPVYAARFVLTSQDYFGLDPRLVYDGELPAIHAERQRPIIDKSNGEFLALMEHDVSALVNSALVRVSSTGLINARYFRHLLDPAQPDPLLANRNDVFGVSFGGQNPTGGDQQLTNGVTLAGQSIAVVGTWKYYYIDVPIGATILQVIATGSGDPATYVLHGSKPNLTSYDCLAYTASPQICIINNPTSGRWWIGVYAHSGIPSMPAFSILAVITSGMAGNILPAASALRKSYTANGTLTAAVNAIDFLNNVILASGRLYRLTDAGGRQRIRAKKSSDSAYLAASASIGNTNVLIANVEPWRASALGYVLIDVGLTTSETRKVTSATYDATTGNAMTLAVSSPGSSITASGAALSGGSTTVPASGTVTVGSVGTVGDLLTVTVFGIPITYTVSSADNVNSIAGMISASINADPNLRQYVRAVWNNAALVTIYCTIGRIGFADALQNVHAANVVSPITGPTAASAASGVLSPGDYYVGYSLVDGTGDETLMSPLTKVTIAASQKVSITSLGALPSGAAAVNWYFSTAPNDDHVQFLLTNSGGSFMINAVADHDADFPPSMNTTGAETIRVMEVFSALNIRAGTFKWSPSKSKINQVTGSYIDAAQGFKSTPITINDRAHQRKVNATNKLDVNLSYVDNFSQGSRLLYAALAENRDAGERWKWATDDAGIPLEIGDVVCVNGNYVDAAGVLQKEFVNQAVMIEETNLAENFDVSFVGVYYSTSLLEGQTGRRPVVISTTLKYFTEPPPVATNVVLTEFAGLTPDMSTVEGIRGTFDFGAFAAGGQQNARIYLAGPSVSAPADAAYTEIDIVKPGANLAGAFEIRSMAIGTQWVKIVTQSTFGKSAASGHPVTSIVITQPPAQPLSLAGITIASDRVITWLPGVDGTFLPETYIVRVRDSGTGTLKRTATIRIPDWIPCKWTYNPFFEPSLGHGDEGLIQRDPDGSIYTTVAPSGFVYYTSQLFYGDFTLTFNVDDRIFSFFNLTSPSPPTGPLGFSVNIGNAFPVSGKIDFITAEGASGLSHRLPPASQIRLESRSGHIKYYINDQFWMDSFQERMPDGCVVGVMLDGAYPQPQAFLRVRVRPFAPRQFIYTDGMARGEFGGVNPATVRFDVTQISGAGVESPVATITF